LTTAFRILGVESPLVTFGEAVREHRLRRGLSQDELAALTGIAIRSIRNIEAGRVGRPRGSTVRLLADAFRLVGGERDAFIAGPAGASPPEVTAPPSEVEVPAQLPRDMSVFAGRDDAVKILDELLDRNAIPLISGTGGVGKTTLAVHWAHRVADRFPDGQLYVNLHGFGPGAAARTPADVLADFLVALGVARDSVPAAAACRSALYRSRLAGRRVLVVLDNARDADQVRPLLPGDGECLAIVTSRDRLAGLVATEGAGPVPLGVLSEADATDLLTRRLGARRLAGEPAAVGDIVTRCDRLPLALAVVAGRAAVAPEASLTAMADELSHPAAALEALSGGDASTDVRSVFSWSYRSLAGAARTVFQMIGLHPGRDVDLYAVANMAGLPPADARRALAELIRLHLVTQRGDRYGMHDLLRAYAAETAHAELSPGAARTAMDRLLSFYQHTVIVRFGEYFFGRVEPAMAPQRPPAVELPAEAGAEGWAEAERANLVATVSYAAANDHFGYATAIGNAFSPYLNTRGHSADCLTVTAVAVDAARAGGDVLAEAVAIGDLAGTLMRFGRYAETVERAEESLRLMRSVGATRDEARMLGNLAEVYLTIGDVDAARRSAAEALDLAQRLGDSFMEALARMRLAVLARDRGELDEALRQATIAIEVFGPHIVQQVRADLFMVLGSVHLRRGELAEARRHLSGAQTLLRSVGQASGTLAWTLNHLARLSVREGGRQAAARHLAESLALARSIDDPELQADALTERALLTGEPADAWAALEVAVGVGHPRQEMLARSALGELLAERGDDEAAKEQFGAALELAVRLGDPDERDRARAGLPRRARARGGVA
jgi:tetratricopeptide (TPR) repeat protein/transcriptional regulator with XRE-family HTH domain